MYKKYLLVRLMKSKKNDYASIKASPLGKHFLLHIPIISFKISNTCLKLWLPKIDCVFPMKNHVQHFAICLKLTMVLKYMVNIKCEWERRNKEEKVREGGKWDGGSSRENRLDNGGKLRLKSKAKLKMIPQQISLKNIDIKLLIKILVNWNSTQY